MKGAAGGSSYNLPAKRRWKGLVVAVLGLVFLSMLVPLVFLLGLHSGFHSYSGNCLEQYLPTPSLPFSVNLFLLVGFLRVSEKHFRRICYTYLNLLCWFRVLWTTTFQLGLVSLFCVQFLPICNVPLALLQIGCWANLFTLITS